MWKNLLAKVVLIKPQENDGISTSNELQKERNEISLIEVNFTKIRAYEVQYVENQQIEFLIIGRSFQEVQIAIIDNFTFSGRSCTINFPPTLHFRSKSTFHSDIENFVCRKRIEKEFVFGDVLLFETFQEEYVCKNDSTNMIVASETEQFLNLANSEVNPSSYLILFNNALPLNLISLKLKPI